MQTIYTENGSAVLKAIYNNNNNSEKENRQVKNPVSKPIGQLARSHSAIHSFSDKLSKREEHFLTRPEFPMAVNVLLVKAFSEITFKQQFALLVKEQIKTSSSYTAQMAEVNATFSTLRQEANESLFNFEQKGIITLEQKQHALDLFNGLYRSLYDLESCLNTLSVFTELEKRVQGKYLKGVDTLGKINEKQNLFNSTIYYLVEKAFAHSSSYEEIEKQYLQNFLSVLQNADQHYSFNKELSAPFQIIKTLLEWEFKEQQLDIFTRLQKITEKANNQLAELNELKRNLSCIKKTQWLSKLLIICNGLLKKRVRSEARYFAQIEAQLKNYHFLQLNLIDFKQLDVIFNEISQTLNPYSKNWVSVEEIYMQKMLTGKLKFEKIEIQSREKNTLKLSLYEILLNFLKMEEQLGKEYKGITDKVFSRFVSKGKKVDLPPNLNLKKIIEEKLDVIFGSESNKSQTENV